MNEEKTEKDEINDAFLLKSTDPATKKKRAILGNGYFGCDVSNNFGQGFGLSEIKDPFPIMYLGGVYGASLNPSEREHGKLDAIFRPLNNFSLIPDKQDPMDVYSSLEKDSYIQTLDMKNAIVQTKGQWDDYFINTEMFLCRNFIHFGILRLEITPTEGKIGDFKYLVRKDPRSKYESLVQKTVPLLQDKTTHDVLVEDPTEKEFNEQGKSEVVEAGVLNIFEGEIKEDGYEFNQKGNFGIIQTSAIKIVNDLGEKVDFTKEWHIVENDLGLDQEWERHCMLRISEKDKKRILSRSDGKLVVTIYFGIFHDYDLLVQDSSLLDYALVETQDIIKRPYHLVKETHADAWQNEIWRSKVEVPDKEVQKMINASMYQMACSFKVGFPNSAGPTGINNHAWKGHVFWDADLWVNMGLLPWAPDLSRCITEFRYKTMDGALQHRKNYVDLFEIEGVDSGIKYPWQSTNSGLETSPMGWESQEHITCDVIFGQYLYYLVSKDENYLKRIAFPIAFHACMYLGQRVKKEDDGLYHFRGVVPADEHPFPNLVDDNAFTNLYVSKCMEIVIEWCKKLGEDYPAHWEDIKNNMFYNFNEDEQRVIEFSGYSGEKIKQADTNLLTFPIEYPFSEEVKQNNMLFYFEKLPENKIMMGSSIFSIIASELDMMDKAWEYFTDLFPHFHPKQFYIASEAPNNDCWPFITGLGGFLGVLYYGFGGIRFRKKSLLLCPRLPLSLNHIVFNQISFQNHKLKLEIFNGGDEFTITNLGPSHDFLFSFRKSRKFSPKNDPKARFIDSERENEILLKIHIDSQQTIQLIKKL